MSSQIVITGAGVVSALGAGLADFQAALYAGRTALGKGELVHGYSTAAIPGFSPQTWLGEKGLRPLDRTARLLCVALHLAMENAQLRLVTESGSDADVGLVCGTMLGSVHSIASFDWVGITEGPQFVSPMEFPNTVICSQGGQAAIRFKLGGVNSTICTGLSSGLCALGYAAEFLRLGRARALFAGGVDELCEETLLGFAKAGAISKRGVALPFAPARDGLVLGEGAALVVLEPRGNGKRNGGIAISGFGSAYDAHGTDSDRVRPSGAQAAIEQALTQAGIQPSDVTCIVSGASGSRAGDERESIALRAVFDQRLSTIPTCAPKAALGETMGSWGAMGVIVAAAGLLKRCLPPTVAPENTEHELCISRQAQPVHGDYALITAFSGAGDNAALVLQRLRSDAGSSEDDDIGPQVLDEAGRNDR